MLSSIIIDDELLLDLLEITLEAILELLGAMLLATEDLMLLIAEDEGLELDAIDELVGVTLPILPTPTFAITIAGTSTDLSIVTL
jgi:hypothetical protein